MIEITPDDNDISNIRKIEIDAGKLKDLFYISELSISACEIKIKGLSADKIEVTYATGFNKARRTGLLKLYRTI